MAHSERGKDGRGKRGHGRHGFGGGMKGHGKGGDPMKLLLNPLVRQRLNLTDDQVNRIKALSYDTQRQAIPLKAQVKSAELELRQAMDQENPDRNRVLAQVDAVAKAKTALARLKVSTKLDLHGILTPQQREQIKQWHAQVGLRAHMGGREGFGQSPEQWQKLREQREQRMKDLRDKLGDRARDRGDRGPRDQGDRLRDRGPREGQGPRDQGAPGGQPQGQPPQPPTPPAQPGGAPQQNPL